MPCRRRVQLALAVAALALGVLGAEHDVRDARELKHCDPGDEDCGGKSGGKSKGQGNGQGPPKGLKPDGTPKGQRPDEPPKGVKPDGTPKKQLDVSRLSALGWRAKIPLEEGLASTVILFRDELKKELARLY